MSAAERLARAIADEAAAWPEAQRFLAELPSLAPTRSVSPRTLAVCEHLGDVAEFAAPSTIALVDRLVADAGLLEWRQTYCEADFGAQFLRRYGWTEVIGLRGPIASERVAVGLLLLGPGIEYPRHAHEAEELYLPLAGEALWMRGDEGFVARRPGEPIEHSSWMPHAMRTRAEPLLALYFWRGGDLAAKSRIAPR